KAGFAKHEIDQESTTMEPLYEAIVKHIPAPKKSDVDYFQMLVSNLDYSDYLGRIAFGRIISGKVKLGEQIVAIHKNGTKEKKPVTAIFDPTLNVALTSHTKCDSKSACAKTTPQSVNQP
ncbi:MAG: hypothetical protein WCK56_04105, partial [Alcaligenaceae bacterium]